MSQRRSSDPEQKNRATQGSNRARALALCAAALVVVVSGCRTAPMVHPDELSYLGRPAGTPELALAAIVRGARRAGWQTESTDPAKRTLLVRYMVRPEVFAVVRIDYFGGRISFEYAGSSGFNCDPAPIGCTKIHKKYNARLLALRTRVSEALDEPVGEPIDIDRAVSTVRQVIEEQPPKTAYTIVDVTDERISAIREVVDPVFYTGPYWDGWGFYPYSYYPYYGYGFYPAWGFGFRDIGYIPSSRTDVVYFNNIGRIELVPDGRWQLIRIWDRYGQQRMKLYLLDEWLAKHFVDSVGVLEQARLEADQRPPGPWAPPSG